MPGDFNAWGLLQQQNVPRGTDGNQGKLRALRGGELVMADLRQALVLEGMVYGANVGTAASPVTFATALTDTQPSLNVDVPKGVAVVPLWLNAFLQTSAGTLNSIIAVISSAVRGNGTSSAITPVNLRSDLAAAQAKSTVRSLYSGAGAATVNLFECYRSGYPFADATGAPVKQFPWEPRILPVIVGPSAFSVYVWATTTAPTGYVELLFAELPPGFAP